MTQIDLAAEPLPSNQFFISTYNDTNRFGKQLTEMKELIKASGNFRSEDEKRICLALAMQVDGALCPVKPHNVCLRRSSKRPAHHHAPCPTGAGEATGSSTE